MRIAWIHNWNSSGDVSDRVWSALCRAWPQADRFTSDPCSVSEVTHWPAAVPRRLQLMGQSVPRHDQLLSRLARDDDHDTARLAGYDLILSSSLAAAQLITNESGALHGCFISTETSQTFHPSASEPAAAHRTSRFDALQQLSHSPGSLVRRPRLWAHEGSVLPPARAGVTHYLATTHAAAAQYHFDIAGQPHGVLYPPIDTTFFRPGPAAHENFYLLVCHPGVPTDVGLVIKACETARRELVILGADSLREDIGPVGGRIRWESLPADAELRSYYRRCRAVLSVAPTGFDPSLVEAQACGIPVIAYHGAATEELVLDAERSGLGTGLFFHTLSAESLVSALHELERRPQNVSAVLSLAQAEKFSPAHFEHGLMNYLNRWLSNRAAQKAASAVSSVPMTTPVEPRLVPQRRAA